MTEQHPEELFGFFIYFPLRCILAQKEAVGPFPSLLVRAGSAKVGRFFEGCLVAVIVLIMES